MIDVAALRLDHPATGEPLLEGSLTVAAGEVVLVEASPGAGGSRLLAALLGEVPPAAGAVRLFERDPYTLRAGALRRLRRRVGLVSQALAWVAGRDVVGQIAFALELDGVGRAGATLEAVAALERVGLLGERDRCPSMLGGAALQRLGLARALVRGPSVVLADQPTAAQDDAGVEVVVSALTAAAAAGAACLVIGRDPRLALVAARSGWRGYQAHAGVLAPLVAAAAPEASVRHDASDLIIDVRSAPHRRWPVGDDDEAIPNVLPFPTTARSVRVG